jgi:hypothetical protein
MNDKYIIILILIVFLIFYNYNNYYLHFSNNLPNWNPISTTHIIFTRYKESDISIILKPFINKKDTTIFIYNKGDDIPYGIPDYAINVNIISIPNLGWDAYGYLFHVINNYYNLPDYIYALHASAQYLPNKYNTLIDILDEKHNDKKYYGGQLFESDLSFFLNDWRSSYELNRSTNSNEKYKISSVRPLKNWILTKISTIPKFAISGDNSIYHNVGGMFFVHKSRILNLPISFYINLYNEISVWQSEVNHYLERSWYIFYN